MTPSDLYRHAVWRSTGQGGGVCYVCADDDACDRITACGAEVGLFDGGGLRIELLDTIKAQAYAGYEAAKPARVSKPSAAPRPMPAFDGG